MNTAERDLMNLLAHTLVEKVDQLGLGVDMIEDIGQDNFKALMEASKAHEAKGE
jgi:hypothetical protein